MALFDEGPRRKPLQHDLGQDLSALSLHELDERLALLRAEIARIDAMRASKAASLDAASAFFKAQD
jgi:uncharacterized small protein (DUF1192 family)